MDSQELILKQRQIKVDSSFYLWIWVLLGVGIVPFVFFSLIAVILEKIRKYREAQRSRDKLFKNIKYLTSVIQGEPSKEQIEEVLAAFRENFLSFAGLSKDSQPYQERIDFISALAWCSQVDIDSIANYREEFVRANPNFKKEIETVVGEAIKQREINKKKK
ncbi:MAG: hypothetical protein J1E31_03810 [Helicobacter sp.]|nr:hypothetical protein [Helicobacter sp.]